VPPANLAPGRRQRLRLQAGDGIERPGQPERGLIAERATGGKGERGLEHRPRPHRQSAHALGDQHHHLSAAAPDREHARCGHQDHGQDPARERDALHRPGQGGQGGVGVADHGADRRADGDPAQPHLLHERVTGGRLDRLDLGGQPVGRGQGEPARLRVEVPFQPARGLQPGGEVEEPVRVERVTTGGQVPVDAGDPQTDAWRLTEADRLAGPHAERPRGPIGKPGALTIGPLERLDVDLEAVPGGQLHPGRPGPGGRLHRRP
jgi:hypothetical protein